MNGENELGEIEVVKDEELQFQSRAMAIKPSRKKKVARMVRIVMKLSGGYIKTENQANFVLVALAAIMLIVSLFFFF